MKRESTVWETIFANDTADKGLPSKMYKELTQLNTRKTNIPINKWLKDLNKHFSEEGVEIAKRHQKMLSITNHQRD